MLKDLLQQGEKLKEQFQKGVVGHFISGEDYEVWISKCMFFLNKNYVDSPLTKRFMEASKNAAGNDVKHYFTMLGVIKALYEMDSKTNPTLREVLAKREQGIEHIENKPTEYKKDDDDDDDNQSDGPGFYG